MIKVEGLAPRPKLLQNLRASRETELMAIYPAKDVASWFGNSVPITMATAESFQRAIIENSISSGAIPIGYCSHPEPSGGTKNPGFQGENRVHMAVQGSGTGGLVGEEGLEPPTSTL
jgi:hypothetical protein